MCRMINHKFNLNEAKCERGSQQLKIKNKTFKNELINDKTKNLLFQKNQKR